MIQSSLGDLNRVLGSKTRHIHPRILFTGITTLIPHRHRTQSAFALSGTPTQHSGTTHNILILSSSGQTGRQTLTFYSRACTCISIVPLDIVVAGDDDDNWYAGRGINWPVDLGRIVESVQISGQIRVKLLFPGQMVHRNQTTTNDDWPVDVVVWLLLLMMMVCNENVLHGCSYSSSGVGGGPGGSLTVVPPNRTKHVEINFNFISSLSFPNLITKYVQRGGLLCMSWLAVDRMRLDARDSSYAELSSFSTWMSVCRIYVSPCWPLSLLLLSWSGDHQCWWYSQMKWSAGRRGSTVGTSKRNIAAPQYVVIAKACRAEEDLWTESVLLA